jgi:2,3-bisphosphoglycerate-independent phosphoglycerate mutase
VVSARALELLVILDGASEPLRARPTSLERARTPVLDRLAAEGAVTALGTVPPGLPAGSETAIPGLLGWVPDAPVDRGAIEAAAHGVEIGPGERAWRVDRRDRVDAAATAPLLASLLSGYRVQHLAGHRMLLVGADSEPDDPELWKLDIGFFVWPRGALPPRVLDHRTVVIGARGAAIGIARLMGASTIVPPGATGRPGSDLAAKAQAALTAIEHRAARVVVHVGAPDEAAHERDAAAKVASIEAADAQLLAPLAEELRWRGGTLRVCPDHGCDPATGAHDETPVPCLDWPTVEASSSARLTERAILTQPAPVAA